MSKTVRLREAAYERLVELADDRPLSRALERLIESAGDGLPSARTVFARAPEVRNHRGRNDR